MFKPWKRSKMWGKRPPLPEDSLRACRLQTFDNTPITLAWTASAIKRRESCAERKYASPSAISGHRYSDSIQWKRISSDWICSTKFLRARDLGAEFFFRRRIEPRFANGTMTLQPVRKPLPHAKLKTNGYLKRRPEREQLGSNYQQSRERHELRAIQAPTETFLLRNIRIVDHGVLWLFSFALEVLLLTYLFTYLLTYLLTHLEWPSR